MKSQRSTFVLILSALALGGSLVGDLLAQGGPVPGKYRGNVLRFSSAASPKLKIYPNATVTSKNLAGPGFPAANFIFLNAGGANNRISIKLELLASGAMKANINGAIVSRTDNKVVPFVLNFTENAPEIGTTSFKLTREIPNFRGAKANLEVSAKTVGNRLIIVLEINTVGAEPGHPLRDYRILFSGNKL